MFFLSPTNLQISLAKKKKEKREKKIFFETPKMCKIVFGLAREKMVFVFPLFLAYSKIKEDISPWRRLQKRQARRQVKKHHLTKKFWNWGPKTNRHNLPSVQYFP